MSFQHIFELRQTVKSAKLCSAIQFGSNQYVVWFYWYTECWYTALLTPMYILTSDSLSFTYHDPMIHMKQYFICINDTFCLVLDKKKN